VGTVVGLYPRPVGVCTVDHTPSMEPAVFAENYGTAPVDAVRLIAGVGMEGDRYAKGISAFSGAKRSSQLTLVAQEDLDAVEQEYGVRLDPSDSLRNIVTRGIALETLIGKRFRVGDALCLGLRLCEPCISWEKYLRRRGVIKAFVHRSGLRADILETGMVRTGDPVKEIASGEDLMVFRAAPSGVRSFMRQEDGSLLCGECGSPFGERIGTAGEVVCHRCGMVGPIEGQVRTGATLRVHDDGPYNLTGAFELQDNKRRAFTIIGNSHVLLCRCGESKTKPFCDSTHYFKQERYRSQPRAAERGEPASVSAEGTVRVSKDGPYMVSGAVTVEDQKGCVYRRDGELIKLCRCGHSSNAPFCDDTHLTNGFQSEVVAGERRSSDFAFLAAAEIGPDEELPDN
jgi:CDGSH-type Zn-finger protein/MOSC domain-containing protein YiiM